MYKLTTHLLAVLTIGGLSSAHVLAQAPSGASSAPAASAGMATPQSTLPPLTAPTSVTPNAGAPGAAGRTDPTNPNNPNDSLSSGLDRTTRGTTDTTNALGSPTAERADASWCRGAGLSANDARSCESRMNTAATDQQRADIQSNYRGRSSASMQSSGGSASLNRRLNDGLGVGANSSNNGGGINDPLR